jgi:hypothetical protein
VYLLVLDIQLLLVLVELDLQALAEISVEILAAAVILSVQV